MTKTDIPEMASIMGSDGRRPSLKTKRVSWLLDQPMNVKFDEEMKNEDESMTSSSKHGADQFEILSFIENGNGSKIYDVIQKQRNRKYTMEVVPRKNSTQDESKNTKLHKHSQLKAPSCYLTQLKYSFQTKTRKYFILSHLHRQRNLSELFQKQKILDNNTARFIIIQLLSAIDHLHQSNVCYENINLGDVYFDNKGHVILKRTYSGQNYWTVNECYGCHKGKCKNKYHIAGQVASVAKANDFNNVGQLFVHLITGSQHSYSLLESADHTTKDFAYLLLRHDVDISKIKNHPFVNDINWNGVTNKELDIPESISMFVKETRERQSSQNSMIIERKDAGSPPEILVGVRKPRSKSEEPSRVLKASSKKSGVRSKSYSSNEQKLNQNIPNVHRSKSFSKSESYNSVFQEDVELGTPAKSRRTSIDMYRKRLEEISKVIDTHSNETKQTTPSTNEIEVAKPRESEFFFEKMYSENEALRTILTKYGLLKDKGPEVRKPQRPNFLDVKKDDASMTSSGADSPVESNNLLSSKRRQSRKIRKNNLLSRSCNNIQILFNENSDHTDSVDENSKRSQLDSSMGKKQKSESCLTVIGTTDEDIDKNNKGGNKLIDRLNGLSKSKTFYMKRTSSMTSPSSPSVMKRHFSDSHIKSTNLLSPNQKYQDKMISAPQALSSLLKSTSLIGQKQTSHDSGLNVDLDERDDIGSRKRGPKIERHDSGLGGSQDRDIVRVWRPGKPDSSLIEQERARGIECYDCGSDIIEPFSNSIDDLCKACGKSRIERKEAVIELIETEINYGEDLKILKEEFYTPLKVNHICTPDEISKLFLNLQELVDVNAKLCASLQHGLEECIENDDLNYISLAIGDVFLNNVEFFEAYEWYCVKQNESVELLKSLTKKSDLLRVFLQVSAQENVKLRKMDLKSFLTMPIQRIMKYPLLLSRIYKHTPKKNTDFKPLKNAIAKVEEKISTINALSKNLNTPKIKKASSLKTMMDIVSSNKSDLTKMVANLKEWKLEETTIIAHEDFEIIETDLVNLTSWSKESFKKISYQQAVIGVNNAPENYLQNLQERLKNEKAPYRVSEIKDAVIVFFKQKTHDKCQVHKVPLQVKDCVVAINLNIKIAFEVTEIGRQPLTFVARNTNITREWRRTLQFVIDSLKVKWRQRRGGRPNIMTEKLHHEDS
ncbi:uncharacterized protein [Clytia hemisphaerica]